MSNYHFASVDVPTGQASSSTYPTGISADGTVSGYAGYRSYGLFTDHANNITLYDQSAPLSNGTYGYTTAIAGSGETAGIYYAPDAQGNYVDSMFYKVNGQEHLTGLPFDPSVVSDTGYIAGYDMSNYSHAFEMTPTGQVSYITIPGATNTYVNGIADNGTVVGSYYNGGTDYEPHPYIEKLGQAPVEFEIPIKQDKDAIGGTYSQVTDVNSDGWIVGNFSDGLHSHGFLIDPKGKEMQIDAPGAAQTFINAINDGGEITGTFYTPYTDSGFSAAHTYVADTKAITNMGMDYGHSADHVIGHIAFSS